jgi:thioredoxin-like negative regulator of GroEL
LEEGLELLYAAADDAPDNGDIAYHVAFALSETGKKQEAVEVLERVLGRQIDDRNFTERAKAEALLAQLKQG